jgi:hypothetical protein
MWSFYDVQDFLQGELQAARIEGGFINEVRKIVSLNFFLDCSKQDGFLRNGSRVV